MGVLNERQEDELNKVMLVGMFVFDFARAIINDQRTAAEKLLQAFGREMIERDV